MVENNYVALIIIIIMLEICTAFGRGCGRPTTTLSLASTDTTIDPSVIVGSEYELSTR